jgi:PAS domain S-box-containing protein
LVQTGLVLAQERELNKIVQAATDAGRQLCGAQFGAFFYNVIDAAGERYVLYTLSGADRADFEKFPMPRNTAVFGPTFTGAGIVRSGDITKDPRYGKNAPRHGMPEGHLPVRSYLAVPVMSRSGEVLGGLFYGHGECDIFRQESEALVQTVAAQAAVAIENFRLHEQLTRKFQDVEIAQTRQQKESRRLVEVLESTSDAVFLLDSQWSFRYLNRNAMRLITNGRDLVGTNLWEMFPATLGSTFEREYRSVMDDRRAREFTAFYAPRQAWFTVRAFPAEEGIAVFFRDVTQEREYERRTQDDARRLRLALDAGQLGTWTWNRESDLLDLDERAAEIFDSEPHQPISRTELRERIVLHEDRLITSEALRQAIEKGHLYSNEYRIQRRDGRITWVLVHGVGTVQSDTPGKLTGMIGVVQDMTARKLQEEALRQSEKLAAAGRMAATIAHEINNPLEAIGNLMYLARLHRGVPADVQEHLELADQELRRVSLIAQQTLGFYRDNSRPVPFDLGEAARNVIAIFQRKLQQKQLECRLEVSEPIRLLALQGEIRQAVSNLLVNAIDASPGPGAILLRIRRTRTVAGEPAVSILVCDRGPGIPPAVRANLFAPFFTTKREIGTGLGLWVTRGIVEKHGGSIRFRSRSDGETGSVFRIILPNPTRSVATQAGAA